MLLLNIEMPYRQISLENNLYYHIFNRGINRQTIFEVSSDYQRSIELMKYYSFASQKVRFSRMKHQADSLKKQLWISLLINNDKLIEIITFCLMPNHFHFLLKQVKDNGISKFMADFQNSYTRYFNTKNNKFGPILQGPFKAVIVENDSQLLHLSRYIHLNPYSSKVVGSIKELEQYPWSSLPEYLTGTNSPICESNIILSSFKNPSDYRHFIVEQADYQRELKMIEHLTLESE